MIQGKILDRYGNIRYYKDDQLHRDNNLPAVECVTGDKHWYQNGKQHRDNDLPAAEWAGGTKCWFLNGERHRLAGPAWITCKGAKFYYLNGEELTKKQHANHPEVKKYRLQQILNKLTA